VLPNIMTCQKFCSVSGGNLITHIFSSRSRESISSGKALSQGQGITKMGPALCYHLVCPYFGNALDLRLYPKRKTDDRNYIFFIISLWYLTHTPWVSPEKVKKKKRWDILKTEAPAQEWAFVFLKHLTFCGGNISFNKARCKYTKKLLPVGIYYWRDRNSVTYTRWLLWDRVPSWPTNETLDNQVNSGETEALGRKKSLCDQLKFSVGPGEFWLLLCVYLASKKASTPNIVKETILTNVTLMAKLVATK
jgi:hypothetical protein